MITPTYVQTMARYNAWQNANIYAATAHLSDEQRNADRGAFFKSLHATLNHILWADQMWLTRFKVAPAPPPKTIPEGLKQFESFAGLHEQRQRLDAFIMNWAARLTSADLSGDLHWYSPGAGRELVTPMAIAVTHFFNHQTHHRGQTHCILTGFGIKPGITDLPFLEAISPA